MKCCGSCFADKFLQDEIARLSNERGQCETCDAPDVDLVEANQLSDKFETLCSIYEPSENGNLLSDWLIEDWRLFAVDRATATLLLIEILDDGERVRQPLSPRDTGERDRLDAWERLRDELRTQNRFFPTTEFNQDRVASLLENLKLDPASVSQIWYRARIEEGNGPFPPDKMNAPPAKNANPGRANPVGIPYLYIGSELQTAVTEVRPHPGETVCIAEFGIENGLEIIDLRNPREMLTPFRFEDRDEVAAMRGDIAFLERLGMELTTPVLPNAAAIDYIPSQYLCEFIKQTGYDGVAYSSSVSDGVNMALFNPENATVGNITRVRVNRVDVRHENIIEQDP